MARPLRILLPGTLWFVTFRCSEQRFLLRPDAECNQIFGYTLAEALERYPKNRLRRRHHAIESRTPDPEGPRR